MATQQLGYGVSGNIGVLGIANANGNFTYYADYRTAIAAAKSGDEIVQFADIVETKPVTIILKNGVNINLNGFTYTVVSTTYNFSSTAAITCTIMNGKLVGGVSINNVSANITTNCIINGTVLINAGTWTGGVINGTISSDLSVSNNVTINNVYATAGNFILNSTTTNINNSVFVSSSGIAVFGATTNGNNLRFNGCIFFSSASYGLGIYSSQNIYMYNCVCISTGSIAIATGSGGTSVNLTAISTASHAMYTCYTKHYNVFAYSSAGNALGGNGANPIGGSTQYSVFSNTFYGGTLIATAAALIPNTDYLGETARNNSFIGTTLDCQWNNPAGYCVVNSDKVINCYLKVANVRANAITSTPNKQNPVPCYIVNNIFQGMLKPIADNVIQAQQNTRDLFNNIAIG